MFPPETYERAMRDAHALLQIVIDSIEVHGSVARVTGRVVRAFRGPLRLGTTLTLGLQVHGPGIPAGPPSGTGSTPIESVPVSFAALNSPTTVCCRT